MPRDKNASHTKVMAAAKAALFEPVIRQYSLKEALHCLTTVEAFFLPGWKMLLEF